MPSRPSFFRIVSVSVLAAGVLCGRQALADVPESPPAAQPAATSLGLVVFGELPADSLREGLSRRLGRPIVLRSDGAPGAGARVTVTYRRSELAVTYDEPGRGTVSRVVPARQATADVIEDAVNLVEALVRNEADELLGKGEPRGGGTPSEKGSQSSEDRPPPASSKRFGAYASLVYPLATNFDEPYLPIKFGIGLYGRAGELDHGLQLGLVNVLSGGEGRASGRMRGLQLAWFANVSTGDAEGLQFSLVNVANGGVQGGQLGYVNVSGGDVDGAQLGFFGNVAAGRVQGGQAGIVNIAGDVTGAQVGLVNVAKNVKGVTLGLINVADDIAGVPIGLISVTKTGGIRPVLWSSSATLANVGVKFATKHTYTMIAAHYTYDGERTFPEVPRQFSDSPVHPAATVPGKDFVGGGFFLGGHIPLGRAYADFDIGGSPLVSTTNSPRINIPAKRDPELIVDARARAMVGLSAFSHLSFFVGGGAVLRTRIIDNGERPAWWLMPEIFGGVQF